MICSKCKANCSNDSLYCGNCGQSLIGSDMQITRNDFTHELKKDRSLNLNCGDSFGDRYKIISELGKGGMGQVFKAHDSVLDIDVALKMIRPEFLMNKKMISRFKQEILLAREITHENVSRIHDFGDVDGIKFISMEFISGRTLKDIVRKDGPIEFEKAIKISKAICNGLSAAHKKEIIHRDLKPQNIMIDDNGKVFITDFGLAKSVREENVSHTGLVIGTPQYIPPELWKGEVADTRSDIYSLGIIMYEMVTGEELFQSDSDYGYLQKHVNEEPEFPSDIKDKLPSFYKQLILRCLAKDRDARYQDCDEINRDISDRLYSTGTFLNDFERSIKKTGFKKIGIAFMLILVISFIGSLILKKGPPVQKKRSVAILYFKNLSGIKDLDHFSYSLPELLTTDLGQSKYIKVLPEDKVSKILKKSNYLGASFIDEKMFEELGDLANVNYLVQGSFIKSGNDLRITVKLRDSDTGELLSTDYQDATVDNIFPAVDRLTTGLKKRFNLTENEIFADIDSEVESITTSSQEALNHYINGKRMFNDGKFEESLVEYQNAIEIDPEFAMAYRNMAWSYALLNNWEKRTEYFEKTIQYIEKLSEREKYLIYGDYYGEKEITYKRAVESYKKILEIYPYDFEANFQIGLTMRIYDEFEEGLLHLDRAYSEDKTSILVLSELVNCYENKGDFKKAEAVLNRYRKYNGDINSIRVLEQQYEIFLAQNKFENAADIIDQLKIISSKNGAGVHYNKGVIQILNGSYEKASELVDNLLKTTDEDTYPDLSSLKYIFLFSGKISNFENLLLEELNNTRYAGSKNELRFNLIYFYIGSGLFGKADKELAKIDLFEENDTPTVKHIRLALTAQNEIAKGNLDKAKILITELSKVTTKIPWKRRAGQIDTHIRAKYYARLGEREKAESLFLQSIKSLKKRVSFEYAAPYFFNTGKFYFDQNDLEKSEEFFLHIQKLSWGRLYRGDLYAKSIYYLGKIYQEKGWTGKAIDSYQKFYDMWKDGDPEYVGKYIKDSENQLKILRINN